MEAGSAGTDRRHPRLEGQRARARYAHINAGHIPDIILGDALYELKCYTFCHRHAALGNGSQAKGGAPSTADGHLIAFGNTLEAITRQTRGLDGLGSPSEPALNRATGVGYVAPHPGDYRGRAPHVPLTLAHSETTGALSPESLKSIAHLDKLANKPAHRDGTHYGSRQGATRSFRRHHISEISSALVYADAETLLAHAEGAPV